MFSDVQTALVELVDGKREAARQAGGPAAGRKLPAVVKPYQGDLLRPEVSELLPAVFVELDTGSFDSVDMARTKFAGALPFEFICAVYNDAGSAAAASDGVALLTWAFEALAGERLAVGDYVLTWERFRFRRIVFGHTLWAVGLLPDIQIN